MTQKTVLRELMIRKHDVAGYADWAIVIMSTTTIAIYGQKRLVSGQEMGVD